MKVLSRGRPLRFGQTELILVTALFLTAFGNKAFFRNLVQVYPLQLDNLPFLGTIAVLHVVTLSLVLLLICNRYTIKYILSLVFVISAACAYFMDSYNTVINKDMIRNAVSTDTKESAELLSLSMAPYVALLAVLPIVLLILTDIRVATLKQELRRRGILVLAGLLIAALSFGCFSKTLISMAREHKILRYYSNPAGPIYGAVKFVKAQLRSSRAPLIPLGEDAAIPSTDAERELVIFVVGETVRADHFSINGYKRKTTPHLEREDILNFTQMSSCGTSTAISVPCMFSSLPKDGFSYEKGTSMENLLDILQRAGVQILWRDNNSDSKGVAVRVPYENFRDPAVNPICDTECRDEGMLSGLQDFIDTHPQGDLFIILHQMGNHGPAYYKRYPDAFEKFKPTCKTNQLENCSQEEIVNAYDNAILYTDSFLKKAIDLLKVNSARFETALWYVSDHGESLGEGGLYLHGLPDFIAPNAQTHVASFMWFGGSYEVDRSKVNTTVLISHDHIFHSLLNMFEIETEEYNANLDILRDAHH